MRKTEFLQQGYIWAGTLPAVVDPHGPAIGIGKTTTEDVDTCCLAFPNLSKVGRVGAMLAMAPQAVAGTEGSGRVSRVWAC